MELNTNQMQAGREMDALVAEKVFGNHVEWVNFNGDNYPFWVGLKLPGTPIILPDGREAHDIRRYSTDITDAWKVLEATDRFYSLTKKSDGWLAAANGYHGFGETAPLAICLLALDIL